MSCSIPTLEFGGNGANAPCMSVMLLVRAVAAVSYPANYGNNANSYPNAISTVNNWNMANIPWGQALFLSFTSNSAFTQNGPSEANLNTAYSIQNVFTANQAIAGAAYGDCDSNVAWGIIRSQVMTGNTWATNGYGPQGCSPVIPLYSGVVMCCSNNSNAGACNGPNYSGGILDLKIPHNGTLNARSLPADLNGLNQAAACVGIIYIQGESC